MTKPLTFVHPSDAGIVEGETNSSHPSLGLYYALKSVAGVSDDQLYEQISKKCKLGFVNAQEWAVNMNAAISIWNQHLPRTVQEVESAYGI
ncbi:hypothetical protein [Comamonas testosteroni]|uniref:hypothetical protein n=1 Tax=Comamonas testosteroni TaxID=285 RepID=UPI0015F9042D|nr:hypothetical protein [Comamonas testosteroni]